MADIELVIKIPDVIYEGVKMDRVLDTSIMIVLDTVKNGTPLPKGHGRLTDLDKIIDFTYNTYGINSGKCMTKDNEDIIDYIYNKAETIIEADNEEKEDV